jgi:hypothetical protein
LSSFIRLQKSRVSFQWHSCMILQNSESELNLEWHCIHLIYYPRALEKLFTILNEKPKGTLGKIKGLFQQPEAAKRLEMCKQELGRMVELFKVCQTIWISMHI